MYIYVTNISESLIFQEKHCTASKFVLKHETKQN